MNRVEFVLWMCCAASCFGACLAGIRIDDLIWFDICLSPETLKSVDLNRIHGAWYIYEYSYNDKIIDSFECQKTIYTPTGENNSLWSTSIYYSESTGWQNYTMKNYFDNEKRPGVLSLLDKEKTDPRVYHRDNVDYYLLDTDYDNFLIGYFCHYRYLGLAIHETFYVLTRSQSFDRRQFRSRINRTLNQVRVTEMKRAVYDDKKCQK